MGKINLNFDQKHFPQISMRYTPEEIRDQLAVMCQKLGLEVTETNMYSMAAMLESDLQHMFS